MKLFTAEEHGIIIGRQASVPFSLWRRGAGVEAD
jgi:hypothetical protein